MVKDYVLCWRSDISPGSVKIVGPFDNERQAAAWGRVWQKAHQDNPCWQCITLEGDAITVVRSVIFAEPGTTEANS